VVVKFINELKESLADRNIKLMVNESVISHIAEIGYDSKMGARPISRKIDELIRVPLSQKLLFDDITNCNINIILNDEIEFEIMPDVVETAELPVDIQPEIDKDGVIVLTQFKPKEENNG
jgi:ATP-dependent Clp protease ATP-binding subunit ClpA